MLVGVWIVVWVLGAVVGGLQDDATQCDCGGGFVGGGGSMCRCWGRQLHVLPDHLTAGEVRGVVVADSELEDLGGDFFHRHSQFLRVITLTQLAKLKTIKSGTFARMSILQSLEISHAPELKVLNGLFAGIQTRQFNFLRIIYTGLQHVPDLSSLPRNNTLFVLDLDHNSIETISRNGLRITADQVTFNYNNLRQIDQYAFNGSQIHKLSIQGNKFLARLHSDAFESLKSLRVLDLSQTSVTSLPIAGLQELEKLIVEQTPSLETVPSIYDLKNLQVAKLTHSFHCCAFHYPQEHNPARHARYEEELHHCRNTPKPSISFRLTKRMIDFKNHTWSDEPIKGKIIAHHLAQDKPEVDGFEGFHNQTNDIEVGGIDVFCGRLVKKRSKVLCTPKPNALNPCEDIMGFSWLRIFVWIVVILAMVGNLAVIVVVLLSGGQVTVSRFLICNLAIADLSMGLYLMLIASMDLNSVGNYFNFAFRWQYGYGCQVAGFLTVFATNLSIFTLTTITIERWFAIKHAIHLTRRIRFCGAVRIMIFGWFYSIFVALLPLVGISNYSSTSICLPMEVEKTSDKAYLYGLFVITGLAFGLMVVCYAQIYLSLGYETRRASIRGEMTIAKKMALLIVTDFATWAPVAFFGLTALIGYPIIGVTQSKILLVFFYPLNACANPYLYAIMTTKFRQDFFLLLGRCGFCRHRTREYFITTTTQQAGMVTKYSDSGGGSKSKTTQDTFV